jgi:ubiquinone/menaquinone biosynthesis C-methylase UbiE
MTESVGDDPSGPERPGPTAAGFDEGFVGVAASAQLRQVWRLVDPDLPAQVEPYSFVSVALLGHVLRGLALGPGQRLVDMACGRGGPGLWLAQEAGAWLVGVDFSAVAVEQAGRRAGLFDLADRARFVVGDLCDTGLPDASADAVVSIDALHFAADVTAAGREALRILRGGRRLVLTNWQPHVPGDPRLPSRHRHTDWAHTLTQAGFTDVQVEARPDWHDLYTRVYQTALSQGDPGDDTALAALQDEARRGLVTADLLDRVVVTATRPHP